MAISLLPKELRLQIWANVYLNEPPRLVALETKPHDEGHDEQHFCPRYCPSPAPIAVNLCQESRTEALYQATKANHIVHLPAGQAGTSCDDFYFRMDTDILLLQLHGPRVKHYDDSPEVGLLAHFLLATGCHPTKLRTIAITKVILHGFRDGSLSNVLRSFPNISRMVMMLTEDIWDNDAQKELFVRAAARIVRMYKLDLMNHARASGETFKAHPFDVDFATLRCGRLDIVPKDVWRDWSDGGDEWATLDNSEPFW
ncbi:hypothetical protein COCC4DRAFT_132796 [Bipolaris maydis ATCC 48331]|uniref:2EXR domain-containing protein n=2 Tax=Cochliobolus heterostrophus TaxID=5016 RepID=M2V035_COCH5|nr:uncharacterized protein COCC4DRAFT_132796 [Bipolaris maydis ATCC 48331]EMD93312.1 hypothetical protein COCHEDRAFT_1095884 [Bipolaris maydis C5]KAH7562265.1 hypothetical protein BM1_01785 [Bipolaris maydis]ENI07239.1 hypothetical protein COCC4DRAFT_132796 [Bipolaris maydis ATCC 48331]KAJ5027647.1 hypothetical protein J3E73DRAFT_368039 [Bipolaris maydis]KAJ5062402.1 hypothetical protein J3E74DRAFT_209254 [Bipolaris maydis]